MIVRSRAPLRLGLGGGGTDVSPYCDLHGGIVLNVTINMYAYCTIEPTEDGKIEFYASDRKERYIGKSETELEIDNALPLHKGLYNRIVRDYRNDRALSFRMTTYSDAPAGSGLGSSSTLVVAMVKAYMEWLNLPLGEYDIAALAYQVERVDVNMAGGRQDQYAATFGGFNYIEFNGDNRVIVNPLRVKRWIQNELRNSLIIYYTGTSRDSARIISEQIENTKKKNETSIEGMHQLKETARCMKDSLLQGDFEGFASCLRSGWEAKKKVSSIISNTSIEETYEYVMANGGKAAKITGAGGGGFMIILCDPIRRYELVAALESLPGRVYQPDFTERGTEAWTLYDE